MLKKLIIVSKKEIGRGKNATGDWTLYSVTDSDKKEYTTFKDLQLDTELELEYTEKPYKDKKTGVEKIGHNLDYPKQEKGNAILEKLAVVLKEMQGDIIALKQRMDFLEIRVKTLSKEEEIPDTENPF